VYVFIRYSDITDDEHVEVKEQAEAKEEGSGGRDEGRSSSPVPSWSVVKRTGYSCVALWHRKGSE
jgi:hypothetical protein